MHKTNDITSIKQLNVVLIAMFAILLLNLICFVTGYVIKERKFIQIYTFATGAWLLVCFAIIVWGGTEAVSCGHDKTFTNRWPCQQAVVLLTLAFLGTAATLGQPFSETLSSNNKSRPPKKAQWFGAITPSPQMQVKEADTHTVVLETIQNKIYNDATAMKIVEIDSFQDDIGH